MAYSQYRDKRQHRDNFSNKPMKSDLNNTNGESLGCDFNLVDPRHQNVQNKKQSSDVNYYRSSMQHDDLPAGDRMSKNETRPATSEVNRNDTAADRDLLDGWHHRFGQIKQELTPSSFYSDSSSAFAKEHKHIRDRYKSNNKYTLNEPNTREDLKPRRRLMVMLIIAFVTVLLVAATILTVVFVNISDEDMKDSYGRYDMSLKVTNRNFNEALANTDSIEFLIFSEEFCTSVDSLIQGADLNETVKGCNVVSLSSGSIYVHFALIASSKHRPLPTEAKITELLTEVAAQESGRLQVGIFEIDPASIAILNPITVITEPVSPVEKNFNEKCSNKNGDKCKPVYAICTNGVCDCIPGRYHESTSNACLLGECGGIPTITNGNIKSTGQRYQDTSTIICNSGYILQGQSVATCQLDKTWSDIGTCEPVKCPAIALPDNGYLDTDVLNGNSFDETATIACDDGYNATGSMVATCQSDGTWSDIATCEPVMCPDIAIPDNAYLDTNILNGNSFGETTTIACDDGYNATGSMVATCQSNGTWSDIATCEPVMCPDIAIPDNAYLDTNILNGNSFGETTTIACDDGYNATGSMVATCQSDGIWSDIATCEPVMCPDIAIPDNAYLDTKALNGNSFGETTTIACDDRYNATGSMVATCQSDGTWSDIATCEPVMCPDIAIPDNAYLDTKALNGNSFGETTTIACDDGYNATGSMVATCQSDGTWSDIATCKPVKCPDIAIPDNAYLDTKALSGNSFGETTTIACNDGYNATGSMVATCQSDGTWSDIATCEPVMCPDIAIPDNGYLDTNVLNGNFFGETTTIACVDGFNIQGSVIVTCQSNQTWSELPVCEIVDCGIYTPPGNSYMDDIAVPTSYLSNISIVCNSEFRHVNDSESFVICGADGQWHGEPSCISLDQWLEWGSWTTCDVTCGEGLRTRYRQCNNTNPSSDICQGHSVEQQTCQYSTCPVYGKWTTWMSWRSCSATCGGGTRTRTRECTKVAVNDIDCVGDPSMERTCDMKDCPDCSKVCDVGVLNDACDTCVCDLETVTIKVKSPKGNPINGASIYASSALTNMLATTDEVGVAIVKTVCQNTNVTVVLETYQQTVVTVDSDSMDVVLKLIEYPHFDQEPISKPRLVGESVTLCCNALANPPVEYYEWFFGGELLPSTMYPEETHLTLDNLQTSDSGLYKCRANSDVGAAFSTEAKLSVKESESGFCEDALIENFVSLPSGCFRGSTNSSTYNIGACNPKSCRQKDHPQNNSCSDTSYAVCQATKSETVTVKCTDYELDYVAVQECGCAEYVEPSFTISGKAVGLNTGTPLKNGDVLVDGVKTRLTTKSGYFLVDIPLTKTFVTLTFIDSINKEFLDMTKRIVLHAGSSNKIYITVNMIQVSEPILIESSNENKIYTGVNASDSKSVAEIIVPPLSYYSADGKLYNGTVKARLTVIEPTNEENSDAFPGQFLTVDNEGSNTNLQSLGVFNLKVYDSSDTELSLSQPLSISFNDEEAGVDTSDYEIWGMNEVTGLWELVRNDGTTASRKKRQFKYTVFDNSKYSWLNIDQCIDIKYCYFSPTVYENKDLENEVTSISLWLDYYIRRSASSAVYYDDYLNKPDKPCFSIACENEDGILDIYQSLSVGQRGVQPAIGQGYNVSDNGRLVHIRLVENDDNGPFYSSETKCKAAISKDDRNKIIYHRINEFDDDVYTFKLVVGITTRYNNDTLAEEADKKVWYFEHTNGATQSCHLKINILNPLPDRSMKIRVMSKVTKLKGLIGGVYGIREVDRNTNSASTCVEYRCSKIKSETEVTVSLIYQLRSHENGFYTVSNISDPLYAAAQSNINMTTFKHEMPVTSNNDGIYIFETIGYNTDSQDESEKQEVALNLKVYSKNKCLAGDIAVVTFSRP